MVPSSRIHQHRATIICCCCVVVVSSFTSSPCGLTLCWGSLLNCLLRRVVTCCGMHIFSVCMMLGGLYVLRCTTICTHHNFTIHKTASVFYDRASVEQHQPRRRRCRRGLSRAANAPASARAVLNHRVSGFTMRLGGFNDCFDFDDDDGIGHEGFGPREMLCAKRVFLHRVFVGLGALWALVHGA